MFEFDRLVHAAERQLPSKQDSEGRPIVPLHAHALHQDSEYAKTGTHRVCIS